jgi:uncharacterized protein
MALDVDPQLMEILACPCPEHAELRSGTVADPEADALTCTACGRSFPVTGGIPVLLLDEALPGTGPATGARTAATAGWGESGATRPGV